MIFFLLDGQSKRELIRHRQLVEEMIVKQNISPVDLTLRGSCIRLNSRLGLRLFFWMGPSCIFLHVPGPRNKKNPLTLGVAQGDLLLGDQEHHHDRCEDD